MRRPIALALAGAPVAALALLIGCSLGLDPSLINGESGNDGGGDGPFGDSPGPRDAGGDHVAVFPDGGGCMTDDDCKVAGNACITSARCDPAQHVCVLGVCEQPDASCKAAVCEQSGSCSIPTTFGFHATSFTVPQGTTGCGGNLAACFAVVWPFAFVGTSNGVTVYQVSDPSNPSPTTVALDGVTIAPVERIVAVDRRVYFLGSPSGSGASTHLPVAWVDVPGIPSLRSLTAQTVLPVSSPTNLGLILPTTNSGIFVVDTATHVAPTEIASAPITSGTTLSASPCNGILGGQDVVASSGSRLLTYGWDGANAFASFAFIKQAGTPNAQGDPSTQQAGTMGQTYPQNTFAEGPDGSVLWMTAAGSMPDGGTPTITAARMAWLVADGKATTISVAQKVDVEVYPSPLSWGTPVAGPMGWLDASTVLVTAADKGDPSQTSVQIASRSGSVPSILAPHWVISANVGRVAAAASNGYGYVLAADLPQAGSDATLHVFAPSCM